MTPISLVKSIKPLIYLTCTAYALLVAQPATAASNYPQCADAASDSDGDGWGWENNGSCQVASQTAQPATSASISRNSNNNSNSSGVPVCTSAASDDDNDGWGYENYQSCIVSDASAPATSAATTSGAQTATSVNSNHPVCSSRNFDEDGDGWGYENNASCIVSSDTAPSTATEATTTASSNSSPSVKKKYPVCQSLDSDPDGDNWGYENSASCQVTAATGTAAATAGNTSGNSATSGSGGGGGVTGQATGTLLDQNFETASLGLYQGDQVNTDWGNPHWHLGFDQGRVRIVDDGGARAKVMQVTYPAGAYGGNGSSAFLADVNFAMGLPTTYNELYIAYDVKFHDGFEFVIGGKLPGLCGSDINAAPSTGCNTGGGYPNGYDGWSARNMWRANGALENYLYHAGQESYYGDSKLWGIDARPGQWHRIVTRIVMNNVGEKDGQLETWLDGSLVTREFALEYRKVATIGINLFYFSTFFGGNDSSWAPSTDQFISFDNFKISTDPIN